MVKRRYGPARRGLAFHILNTKSYYSMLSRVLRRAKVPSEVKEALRSECLMRDRRFSQKASGKLVM